MAVRGNEDRRRGQHNRNQRTEPGAESGVLDLTGDDEVGEGEVGGDEDGAFVGRLTDGVDLGLHLDGFLGIGEDVLAHGEERYEAGGVEVGKDDSAAVL